MWLQGHKLSCLLSSCYHFRCANWVNVDSRCASSHHVACSESWWLDHASERWEMKAWNPSDCGEPGTLHSQEFSLMIRLPCKKWLESLLQAILLLFSFSRTLRSEEASTLKNFHCMAWVKAIAEWSFCLPPPLLPGTISYPGAQENSWLNI